MKLNVGGLESLVRISIGVALIYGALYGYIGYVGLFGVLILATGVGRFSPLKALMGINHYHEEESSDHYVLLHNGLLLKDCWRV